MNQKIGKLPSGTVYRRKNSELFSKLNEKYHVRIKLSQDQRAWVGDGFAEEFDPNEEVEVIQS